MVLFTVIGIFLPDPFKILLHPLIHIPDPVADHFAGGRVVLRHHAEMLHLAESADDILGDIAVVVAPVEPWPSAVAKLFLPKLAQRPLQFVVHPVEVEEEADALLAFRLVPGLHHPGGFFEKDTLEFLVLFELRKQGIRRFRLPAFKNIPDLRVFPHDMGRKAVGIHPVEYLLGTFVRIFHQVREGLHGIPCRVRRKLDGVGVMLQGARCLSRSGQLFKPEVPAFLSPDRQGHGFRHQHAVPEHRDHRLFAVAEIARPGRHTAEHRPGVFGDLQFPANMTAVAFRGRKFNRLFIIPEGHIHGLHADGVEKLEAGVPLQRLARHVHHPGAEPYLVAFPEKAWLVGQDHQLFLRDKRSGDDR